MARIGALDSDRFRELLRRDPILVLPVGALEAHGPHLPLAADQIQAEATAEALAERWSALVAPTVAYGSCVSARTFPGTVAIPPNELTVHVGRILAEFRRMGVGRFLVLSGHAERGHLAALRAAAEAEDDASGASRTVVLSDYEFVYELRGREAPETDGHAGLLETSRMLALAPTLVGPERPIGQRRRSPYLPGTPGPEEWPMSVDGDTRLATAELGRRVHEHVLERLNEVVPPLLAP